MRILSIVTSENGYNIYDHDCYKGLLEYCGYEVDQIVLKDLAKTYKTMDISKYDNVILEPLMNDLWYIKYNPVEMFTFIFKTIGRGILFISDITYPLAHKMYDEGKEDNRINIWGLVPFDVFPAFYKDIENDEEAMKVITSKWLRHLHPESKIHFLNWENYYVKMKDTYLKYRSKSIGLDLDTNKYSNFYYGLEKHKLVESLVSLGLGEKENDLLIGPIAKTEKIKNQIVRYPKERNYLDYLEKVDYVLMPYEKIKGDYQVTTRMVECLWFYSDKVKVDERIDSRLKEHLFSEEIWLKELEEVKNEIKNIFEG